MKFHLLLGVFFTLYSVVAGLSSNDVKAKGVPEPPPGDVRCTALTPHTMYVSWNPPPPPTNFIRAYKVIYGPSASWFDENTKDSDINIRDETILHNLRKNTNYTIVVATYSTKGAGVYSKPIHCQTDEDVPEAPLDVRALAMSDHSIIVYWKPLNHPNGVLEYYIVYYKQAGTDDKVKPQSQMIVPQFTRNKSLSYQANHLNANLTYEFWVTANTLKGEGLASKKVIVSPKSRVPARIASFNGTINTSHQYLVTLDCPAVGDPIITWKINGREFEANKHIRKEPDGSLEIRDFSKKDAGEYSCHVKNDLGQDTVRYQLAVNEPPYAPQVTLIATTATSLTIQLKPNSSDIEPIYGYSIHYKPEFGNWDKIPVGSNVEKYNLDNLLCGTKYQLYVTAYNNIGIGDPSTIFNFRTTGDKPVIPSEDKFIVTLSDRIILHLKAWKDGGCPLTHFVVEHKKKINNEWIQASQKPDGGSNLVLPGLDSATWYNLRVTAHNSAGFSVAEFEVATLEAVRKL